VGIVVKQAFKGAFYSYLGVILGGVNVAILFPLLFTEEQIGLINILLTVSVISAQFSSLGAAGVINYFFPNFRNKENAHNSFFIFVILFASIGFFIFSVIFYFYGDIFLSTKDLNTSLQERYYLLLYPLTFFTVAFIIVDMFCSSTFNSSIGNLYKDVVVRIIISILIVLYYFKFISFGLFILLYTLNMATPVIALLVFMVKKGDVDFKLPKKSVYAIHIRKIFSVGIFYIISGLSDVLASYIDKYMISYYLGLRATGIYSITNYFGALTRIPRASIGKIGTPLIASLLAEKKYSELSLFLKKSSISQILLGVFIFINIWVNIDLILSMLPDSYICGKWVVFYISLSHIFYCFLGLGGVMLKVSTYYKTATIFTIGLGVMVIIFNLLLIPYLGITGAALSTALSKFIYVFFVLFFIKFKMKIKVFYIDSIKILSSGYVALILIEKLSLFNFEIQTIVDVVLNIVIKSFLVSFIYVVLLFITRFIKNINQVKSVLLTSR